VRRVNSGARRDWQGYSIPNAVPQAVSLSSKVRGLQAARKLPVGVLTVAEEPS
jgi:hypothetical protein